MTTTQETLVELCERLRKLMAEASPQPWVYRPSEYDDWGWIRGVEKDSDIGRYRPIVANAKNSDVSFDDMDEYRRAGTDPYGPNAMLIVEAVNALPALLDALTTPPIDDITYAGDEVEGTTLTHQPIGGITSPGGDT